MRRAHFLTAISFLGFFSELSAFSAVNFPAPLRPWRPLREAPGGFSVRPRMLDLGAGRVQIPTMHTLKVDSRQRVRLPEARPGQVFSYTDNGDGSFMLVLCEAEPVLPKVKIVKEGGLTLLSSNREVSNADTERVMAEFP